MRPSFHLPSPSVKADDDWLPDYPNPPDLRFNYFKLLADAASQSVPIGRAPSGSPRVAVVGAGVAGLTVARELFRCGYSVTILEARERICGRQYSKVIPGQQTAMELGAMRFPFFTHPGAGNSLSDYYLINEAGATTKPFPNPGSAPGNTGIYLNNGYGPAGHQFDKPTLIPWPAPTNGTSDPNPPDNPQLAAVYTRVREFQETVTDVVSKAYTTSDWPILWRQIAEQYDRMSFGDLVFTDKIQEYQNDGWFGGLGMNEEQSSLFYTIGAGDGSWGAFYEVGAMWFLRCVMFGFSTSLQSVLGILDKTNLPYYNQPTYDSQGADMGAPQYAGIQTLGEWLMYAPPPEGGQSLYEAVLNKDATVLINSPVTVIEKVQDSEQFLVTTESNGSFEADFVVVTSTLWSSQLSIQFKGFLPRGLPSETVQARNEQHNISSCKVFFALKEPYWLTDKSIPQILVTDTVVQDAYGIQWDDNDPGALLASYTWEDDALKLLSYKKDDDLAKLILGKLDEITVATTTHPISQFVDSSKSEVIHWLDEPFFHGCAKLYRPRKWHQNYALLAYNQQHSPYSRMYFAGENYSVEGGWSEPALRTAIDAVIHLLQNSGGTFTSLNYANYPVYDMSIDPNLTYPYRK